MQDAIQSEAAMTQIDDGVDRLLLAPEGNNLISVLLVEDDASTSTVMIKLLASLGYKVQSAPCIADALRIVESGPVDVVLSDIGLPDGNGYELMTEIRKRCPAVG